ncbi:MAG: hypothetical protein IH602_13400, partial [Bryobacteraceae bacterium]|nr:hypothetical protein [Bryobacteraceae bacterium]
IQTGSVAGKVTVLVTSVQVDNQTVQLGSTPVHTVEVASAAPTISSIQVVRNSSGFEIRITGDSSVRQMADLSVTFSGPAGSDLLTTSLTISLADLFTAYFNNSNSSRFGSTYLLTVPFVIEGTQSAVNSFSATLTNRIGRSATSSATF